MKNKVVFDANILILLSKDEIDSEKFANTFCRSKWLVSIVTKLEVLSKPQLGTADRQFLLGFLSKCKIVNLSRKIASETIQFRSLNKRKLPDSIVAATAVVSKATLISNDSDLLNAVYPGLSAMAFL
jgi:predicted nucleic acid-binding protein